MVKKEPGSNVGCSTRPTCRRPKTTRRGAAGLFCGCDRLAGGTVSALNGIDSVAVKLAKGRLNGPAVLETPEMFHIGQRVLCVDDRFVGENCVFDPTFRERCPSLPVKGRIYTVRGFVVPYAEYAATPGILLEEIINPPCSYVEGTFEPSFFPSHFRPLTERKPDISVFAAMLTKTPEKV